MENGTITINSHPHIYKIMETKTTTKIAITAGILALIVGGYKTFTISDSEVQTYIQEALIKGCKPVLDLCESNCKSIDVTKFVKAECIPTGGIMRIDYKRAQNNYIKLAEKLGVKNIADFEKLPTAIRTKLSEKGSVMETVKEDLSVQIK